MRTDCGVVTLIRVCRYGLPRIGGFGASGRNRQENLRQEDKITSRDHGCLNREWTGMWVVKVVFSFMAIFFFLLSWPLGVRDEPFGWIKDVGLGDLE